jgi:hypothetical protein
VGSVICAARKHVDEVIVINDGSIDNTREIALEAGARVIDHPVNLGYGAAISSCLAEGVRADADIIVTLDADLQHDAEEIPILVKPIIEGTADIVTGSRFISSGGTGTLPLYRRWGITVLTKITNFMAQTAISDATTGFRAYSNQAARTLASMPFSSGMGASSQILMGAFRSGLKIAEIPVIISYVTGVGTSSQNALVHGLGDLTSIIRYITIRRPLSLIGIPGLAILTVGIAGLFMIFDIFNATRIIPTGLGMFTVATSVIGLVILLGSLFLYSLSTVSKQLLMHGGITTDFATSGTVEGSKKTSIIRYITIRRPLSLIGIPGLAILTVGIAGLFMIFDIFNATRIIPTGLGMFTVATSVIGLVLLMTSVILYTMSKILFSLYKRGGKNG